MSYVFLGCATTSILAVLVICLFLFISGVPAMFKVGLGDFLVATDWSPSNIPPSFGILPMILGSIMISLGAVLIGVPIGILTAVYLAKFCPAPIYRLIKPMIELLAGIPSIVYGFFGMVVLVPFIREEIGPFWSRVTIWLNSFIPFIKPESAGNGNSILTACILLGIMILPTIITLSETALRAVPEHYFEGALALGATTERSIFSVMIPAAISGIMGSIILGIGRAIGETMAVIIVAGNQPRMPVGILKGIRTLTANIVIEKGYSAGLHREMLIATGVVLFVFILLINVGFHILKRRMK